MHGTVRVRLLGDLAVEHDGRRVGGSEMPGRQGRLVVAYLALSHHPVSRDDLADLVWSGRPPSSWPRDLSAVVSKVRAALTALGHPGIELGGALGCYELRLPADSTVDVESAFRFLEDAEVLWRRGEHRQALGAADTAANLCRRPFLAGERGLWVEQRRRGLLLCLLRALDLLVEGQARLGYHHDALRHATEAVDLEPFRESGYLQLMRLHVASGNRAEALRVYERCRHLLAEELGVPPSPAMEEAYRETVTQ